MGDHTIGGGAIDTATRHHIYKEYILVHIHTYVHVYIHIHNHSEVDGIWLI